jgi:hypothetical protein
MFGLSPERLFDIHCLLIFLGILSIGVLLPRATIGIAQLRQPVIIEASVTSDSVAIPRTSHARGELPPPSPASYAPTASPGAAVQGHLPWCAPLAEVSPRLRPQYPDWTFAADGASVNSWAAQFLLAPGPAEASTPFRARRVHLVNRLSGGCVNHLGGAVRGHRDSSPRDKAAPPSATTELQWEELSDRPAGPSDCRQPMRVRFRFTQQGEHGAYLAVRGNGHLGLMHVNECNAKASACDFDLWPREQPAAAGTSSISRGGTGGGSSSSSSSSGGSGGSGGNGGSGDSGGSSGSGGGVGGSGGGGGEGDGGMAVLVGRAGGWVSLRSARTGKLVRV